MKLNIPTKVRAGLYIFTTLGTPVVGYCLTKNYIGEAESVLWFAWVTAITSMAAFNTDTTKEF